MRGPQGEYIPGEHELRELIDLQRDIARLEQERHFLSKDNLQARLKKTLLRLHELKGCTDLFLVRHGIEPE
jgi:hypothetical protein